MTSQVVVEVAAALSGALALGALTRMAAIRPALRPVTVRARRRG
ncbi:hypothetical protein [Methylobacterium sp. NEAU K]|nr:hypothetical protein [Methylobacterium sp. NEAU K]MDP4005133.1 hypothetical protein [Methylobacterium sp. NEAU K]